MTAPDPRIVAALAAKVLPEGWTIADLRQPHLPPFYAKLADRLDGPLAEAWRQSVRAAAKSAWCEWAVHEDSEPDEGQYEDAEAAALRALEEPRHG